MKELSVYVRDSNLMRLNLNLQYANVFNFDPSPVFTFLNQT